jgi:amidase
MQDLMFRSALELAGLVHSGEVSATELVRASLERISERDGAVGAFVEVDAEGALAAAAQVGPGDSRPFAGVPIAIKNNRAWRGHRYTMGCGLLADYLAEYDHSVVARLLGAGFIPVGTTKLPEYGILPTTEPRLHGPTRNPWDLTRTAGGSSGGSAAAVAAGMVPVAHGNDGGGSIRIPAACCGLVGLKPQRGRTSSAPDLGDSMLVVDGVLARTVGDSAALLDVLAGPELGDATWAPPPERPFAEAAAEPAGRLRVAMTLRAPLPDAAIDPLAARAVHDAAERLRSLGHEVEEVDPPWADAQVEHVFQGVFSIHAALSIGYSAMLAGRAAPAAQDVEPLSWALWERSHTVDAVRGEGMRARLQIVGRALVRFLDPYDALLTPALAERPLPLGTLDSAATEPFSTFQRAGLFTPFTPVFNATGQPAISLPLFQGPDGLPLAVQLAGRPAEEGTLLALAAQLEAACPWADRRPPE